MKRFLIALSLAVVGGGNAAFAAEVKIIAIETQPSGSVVIEAHPVDGNDNNVCKWFPDGPPGKRRNLGQTFSIGKKPFTLTQVVVRLASIPNAVSADAPGAKVSLKLMQFSSTDVAASNPEPMLEVTGKLPEELQPGQYLVFEIPPTPLESGRIFGFEIGFESPSAERAMNLSMSARTDYPQGRAYHHTDTGDGETMNYVRQPSNLEFYLLGE